MEKTYSTVHLKDIAEIHSGMLFPQFTPDNNSQYYALQYRDVREDGSFIQPDSYIKAPAKPKDEQILKINDVVVKSKGQPIAAYLNMIPDNTILSSHYFLLRGHAREVRQEFLAWYINQRPAQNYLQKNSQGTSVKTINKKVLEEMPIAVLPLEQQLKLIELHKLIKIIKNC
jgi:restriction endonuclease S subunit